MGSAKTERQIWSDLACESTYATKVFEIAEGIFPVNDGSPPECNQGVPGPGLDGVWQSYAVGRS